MFKLNISNIKGLLIKSGKIDEATASLCVESSKMLNISFEQTLVDKEILSKDEIYSVLNKEYGIPYIDIKNLLPDYELLSKIEHSILIETKSFPVSLNEESFQIAMSEPLNIFHIDRLKNSIEYEICPFFSDPQQIIAKQQEVLGKKNIEDKLKTLTVKEDFYSVNSDDSIYFDAEDSDDSLFSFITSIISDAAEKSASDIHFDPNEKEVKVRFRVDGNLSYILDIPEEIYPNIVSRIKLLSSLNISEKRLPQDGGFDLDFQNLKLDIRTSFVPTLHGEKAVLRIANKKLKIADLNDLGLCQYDNRLIRRIIERQQGLILVTGPTGSGKTTTLYSILKEMNTRNKNIITIEDPVEQKIEGLNQIQINTDIGLDFENVLRHVLRQDPDIIMVGEIRDLETAKLAISAAITGHMVLSTLHTEDSASAVMRLMDMGVEKHMIISALRAVISQRLYRKNCSECLVEEAVRNDYISYFKENDIMKTFSSKGCNICDYTSCSGRGAIFEILEFNDMINELFKESLSINDIRNALELLNHQTLKSEMLNKIKKSDADFREYIKLFGI